MAGKACFAITAFVTLIGLTSCSKAPNPSDAPSSIPDKETAATDHIAPNVQALIDAALADPYAYDKLAELCDEVGHRLAASPGMKQAIAWSQLSMYQAGFDSVWTEPVTVAPLDPRPGMGPLHRAGGVRLAMTGLGLSDGTGVRGRRSRSHVRQKL